VQAKCLTVTGVEAYRGRMTIVAAPTPQADANRLVLSKHFPQGYVAMLNLQTAISAGPLDPLLSELVKLRASQLNGCAYFIDMHTKDARALGESEERMHLVAAWREAPGFTPRERVALCEAITLLTEGHVPDDVWNAAATEFDPDELMCLVWQCIAINSWNRVCVATRAVAGKYRSSHQPVTQR
jgi:AhpD family alkylhydroperoxidase